MTSWTDNLQTTADTAEFNNKIFFLPGIERSDSSEDELDESTVEEEVEEEKGKQTGVTALHSQQSTGFWKSKLLSERNILLLNEFLFFIVSLSSPYRKHSAARH